MGWNGDLKRGTSGFRATAPESIRPTAPWGGIAALSRSKGLAGQQITQTSRANDQSARAHKLGLEVLDDEGVVVVSE